MCAVKSQLRESVPKGTGWETFFAGLLSGPVRVRLVVCVSLRQQQLRQRRGSIKLRIDLNATSRRASVSDLARSTSCEAHAAVLGCSWLCRQSLSRRHRSWHCADRSSVQKAPWFVHPPITQKQHPTGPTTGLQSRSTPKTNSRQQMSLQPAGRAPGYPGGMQTPRSIRAVSAAEWATASAHGFATQRMDFGGHHR